MRLKVIRWWKAFPAAARCSQSRCTKRTMTEWSTHIYRMNDVQLTDFTVLVTDLYHTKRTRSAWRTDKAFYLVIVRLTYVTSAACPLVVRPWIGSTGQERTRTGQVQNKERTSNEQNAYQRMVTVHLTDNFIRLCTFQILNMFKTFHRTERTPPDTAGQEAQTPHDKRKRNACERTWTDWKFCHALDVR